LCHPYIWRRDGHKWGMDQGIHGGVDSVALPLGAIVGTAVLTDCVPIEAFAACPRDEHPHACVEDLANGERVRLYPGSIEAQYGDDVSDQLPFGDFAAGRFAWLLSDARAFDTPIECRGRQGVWTLPDDLQWLSAQGVLAS